MKSKILFILCTLLLFCHLNIPYAEGVNKTITIDSVYNDSGCIVAKGQINSNTKNQITILVLDENEEISYIDQKESNPDGSFEFRFKAKNESDYGQYTIRIGGDAVSPPSSVTFDYREPIQLVKNKFLNGSLNISINSFIPRITGTIECLDGKEAEFKILNVTDNTVIENLIITPQSGIAQISATLPNLLYTKEYKLIATAKDGDENLLSATLDLSSSPLSVGMTGTVTTGENVWIDGSVRSLNNNLINEDMTFTGSKSVDYTLPKLMSYGSYNLDFSCYENIPFVPGENQPESLTDTYTYNITANEDFNFYINLKNITDLQNKVITISFDSSDLTLTDGYLFSDIKETSGGIIPGTGIEILSVSENSIAFSATNYPTVKRAISGSISGIGFRALQDSDTSLTVTINEKEVSEE